MNKTLSFLFFFTILLGSGLAIQNDGGSICGHCGNNEVETLLGEACDDGNNVDGDGCNSQCQIEKGYTCATIGGSSTCSLILTNSACGNRVRNSNEQCDDGNTISGDGCSSNCFIEPGHTCTDPSPPEPDLCTYTFTNACGNGILEQENQQTCDDGNQIPGDGCGVHCIVQTHYSCTTEGNSVSTCVSTAVCGNNIKQPNEQCDNGQTAGCTDCTIDPDYTCTGTQNCAASLCYHNPECGDGVKEGNEECDAGLGSLGCIDCKIIAGFTCTEDANLLSACVPIPDCGNGILEDGEECDNANTGGCTNCQIDQNYACQASPLGSSICYLCGNNIIQYQEECDNGNQVGCTNCQVDPGYYCITQTDSSSVCVVSVCGNGIKEPLQQCDNFNKEGCFSCLIVDGYNCYQDANNLSICTLGTCGNGIKEGTEQCDNFNALGCLNCKVDPAYDCTEDTLLSSTCTLKPICGNGGKEQGQECDNGNKTGCIDCKIADGYSCFENVFQYSICTRDPYCGDSIRQQGEQCDNGNKAGCSSCSIDPGYVCRTLSTGLSVCTKTVCGDKVIQGTEVCDNGAQAGCPLCTAVESGYQCVASGAGSVCTLLPICGDMIRQASHEECDGGVGAVGCTNCKVDTGYSCNEDFYGKSYCYQAVCGNRIKQDNEECDNGRRLGCTNCEIDPGFECTVNAAGASVCNVTGTCGDNVRDFGQECDNGNQEGCLGCTVDFGYECNEGIRRNSYCAKTVCGDRIKQEGEQCDNGRAQGCPNCRIADGYQCATNAVGLSTCTVFSNCGNNKVEGSEQCDNGNQAGCISCIVNAGYTCSGTSCIPIPAVCNNFIREVGQECDNGGYLGCTNNCKVSTGFTCLGDYQTTSTCARTAACGDNALQPSLFEVCDDGNTNNNDGCSSTCQLEFGWSCPRRGIGYPTICHRVIEDGCGDGIFDPAREGCDDYNNKNGDGCSKYCLVEEDYTCQIIQRRSVCVLKNVPVGCGDGKVDFTTGQECDDGDNDSYDGCSSGCQIEWGWECRLLGQPNILSICSKKCGNGFYQPSFREACDDGNNYNNDGCSALCEIQKGFECPLNIAGQRSRCFEKPPIVCGNGEVEEGEECDDGFAYSNDGCSSTCRVESGWQCGGNPSYCFYKPVCGNAIVQTGQFCDDGNTKSGDGCNVDCRIQSGYQCYSLVPAGISTCKKTTHPICGNGVIEYGQQCDDGNTNKYDGCFNCQLVDYPPIPPTPTPEICGDAKYQPTNGEACDNGNQTGCYNCQIQTGYICINKIGLKSVCYSEPVPPTPLPPIPPPQNICGNGRFEPAVKEECDDGNTVDGDGCSRKCVKQSGYYCNIEIGVQSICFYPYTCKFSRYVVPYIKLCPAALNALAGTSLQDARTVLDIIKTLIEYDATNALIRESVLAEMDDLIYNADSTEWGIIAYNINACTGYTSL